MAQEQEQNRSYFIGSIVILILTVGAFIWLIIAFPRPDSSSYRSTANLTPVNIDRLESQVKPLLSGLTNNSGIPIAEPVSKEGRADPFASL
ncbi:MAG: hypothetical protein NTW79_00780 [Candidatus Berkelbacteria bacterium]|nr:hypothetical protein [Candidatus Berkelbacteria bacterium]